MEINYVDTYTLVPYVKNAKEHPQEQVLKIADSITEFGFQQPIVVDKNNVIIVGHGRLEAAKKLGMEQVPVLVVDLTDEQAKAYRLADNKLNESAWDMDLVIEELKELSLPMAELTGFDLDLGDNKKDEAGHTLAEVFGVPPFSVLDTRQGYWLERKRAWKVLIEDNGESREGTLAGEASIMSGINSGVSLLDPVLAEIAINWFCPHEGTTFDNFAGDTVFGYVSAYKGHEFTGIELREEQAKLNNERCSDINATYICDDGRNVREHIKPESKDLLFSCPPYYDLEVYSNKENDASNQETYEDFIAIIRDAFTNAVACLKQDRFAFIVVGDIRAKDGSYYGYPDDIKRIFKDAGMVLYNELILVEPLGTLPQRVANSMKNRKVGKCHQNVLVFYKGDMKNIKNNFPKIEYESTNEEL